LFEKGRQPGEHRAMRSAIEGCIHALRQWVAAAVISPMVEKQNRDLWPGQLQGFGKRGPFGSDQLRVENHGIASIGDGDCDRVIGRERQQDLVSLPLDRFLQRAQTGQEWADAEYAFIWLP
jgi:hypothetical protein